MIITIGYNILSFKNHILNYIIAFIGTYAFMILSILFESVPQFIKNIGKESLVILCVHGPLYRIVIKIVSMIFQYETEEIRKNLVLVIFITIITLVISNILYKIFPIAIGKNKVKDK